MKKFKLFSHINTKTIKDMYNEYTPVFILTTGRSGSMFIHEFLSKSNEVLSYHEASPRMQYFVNYSYHNQSNKNILTKMFEAARMELILDAFNKNQIYVESNQCLVFFAYVISDIFKNARFIHIIRHPGNFVVSAIKKGWHLNDNIWEAGRIKMKNKKKWSKINQVEKLAWTWTATNRFITDFGTTLNADSFISIRIEDIFSDIKQIHELLDFIGVKNKLPDDAINDMQSKKINEIQIHPNEPPNMKKVLNYPEYEKWPEKDKEIMKKHVEPLSDKFRYTV